MDKMIVYHIWNDGDPSVGISGNSAIVEMFPPADKDEDKFIRENLKKCFEDIWDFRCMVMSEEELAEEDGNA